MIDRAHRFHGRASIQRLYKNGRTVRTGSLSLRYAPNPRGTYRLAVVVSRKVSKSAVIRNRIRRRIYENVRIMFTVSPAPYDMALTVFDERIAKVPAATLAVEVSKLFAKARLTTASPAPHGIVEHKS